MRMVYMSEEGKVRDFAEDAARHFAKHKEHTTYTHDKLEEGCLFAMRWGWGNDCVVIFRLDEDFEPVNYQQLIK